MDLKLSLDEIIKGLDRQKQRFRLYVEEENRIFKSAWRLKQIDKGKLFVHLQL